MNKNIKLLLIIILITFGKLSAQDSLDNYMNRINYIFANVDHNKVTTGLLSDFGIQIIPPEYYDGALRDSNEVDIQAWRALYAGMDFSRFNTICTLPTQADVFNAIINNTPQSGQPVPFAVMYINYNALRSDADSAGLVTISNDQIYDVAGKNPYETSTLFAAAPVLTNITGPGVQFVLKSSLYYSNSSKIISLLQVDPGDGGGFRTVNWDSPFSVTYTGNSIKSFIVKFSFSDGTNVQTHGKINVDLSSSLKSGALYSYYNIDPLTHTINPSSNHSGGTITVRFGSGHSDRVLRKPFIVAEGFDVWKVMYPNNPLKNFTIDQFLINDGTQLGGYIDVPISPTATLESYLYDNSYDIVFLDYNDGTDDITRNASLFEETINWVNSTKTGNEPNVVLGISMGGLVARYALRHMEQEGINHQTLIYMSMDSPHRGANVPVGAQAALYHAESFGFYIGIPGLIMVEVYHPANHSDDLQHALNLLNTPAAKQMLIYRAGLAGNGSDIVYDNSTYQSFMNTYHSMGMPSGSYNIAMSDGSGNGNGFFGQHAELLLYSASYSLKWWQELLSILGSGASVLTNYPQLFINIIPGKTQIRGFCNMWAIPSSPGTIYHAGIYVHKKLLWLITVNTWITEKYFNSVAGMVPVDGAPGGAYDISNILSNLNGIPADAIKQQQFCFVPAVSALDLTDWSTYLTSILNNYNFISIGETPFQSYYTPMPNYNADHTRFDSPANYIKSILDMTEASCITNSTFQNTTITKSQTIIGCKLNINNVSIQNNSTVIFDAGNSALINGTFVVNLGSTFVLK